MTPSLAPEWIEARVMKELMLFPIGLRVLVVRCFEKNLFVDSEQLFFSRLDPFFSFVE